jgi:2-(1,2-epoxy-1,2-dihydrophenyl)acetyl-CoA isomerase
MTAAMLDGLEVALEQAATSDLVGAVVLTGAGSAFCAGGDVKDFGAKGGEGGTADEADPARVAAQRLRQQNTVGRIHEFAKPVLASLPGAAAGAGLGLALAADLRVGCPRTLMTTAFVTIGLSGDYGTAWLLDRLVGPSRARELMFLGGRVDAERCRELGLVNELVPADELAEYTQALAARLANGPRTALRYMKQNLLAAPDIGLGPAMDAEAARHLACGVTDDHREALAAYLAKRPAVYSAAWK